LFHNHQYKQTHLKYNFSSTYRGNYENFWDLEIKNEFESKEKFKELWDNYSKLEHHFHVIDIVNQPNKLFDLMRNCNGTKLLWTTNIWASMQLHWNIEPEELEQKWFDFEKLIPEDLVIYGQDYLARDIQFRVRNNLKLTHPRYENNNRYLKMKRGI
jgi:hypothetical protein